MVIQKTAEFSGHNGAVFAITEGVDEPHILSGGGDGWVVEWDLTKPELGRLIANVERNIFSLIFLKKQNKLIVGDMDGGVRFIDLNEPSLTHNRVHHGGKGCFGIKMIDNQLITIGGDGVLTRWSVAESRSLESVQLSHKSLRCFDFSKEKNELAIGASDGNVYILDATNLELKYSLKKAHTLSVFSIKYTPNGLHLLTGGRDAYLKLWQLPTSIYTQHDSNSVEYLKTAVPAHLFTINAIVFHPRKANIFATASRDKTIKIWQYHPESAHLQLLKVIDTIHTGGHLRSVNNLFWSSFEDSLISASDDRTLMVWKITF